MSLFWYLILGLLTGWVFRQHREIQELKQRLSRQPDPTPTAPDSFVDARDVAAAAVDKHVQEFHRR